jgi:hypothetical protein
MFSHIKELFSRPSGYNISRSVRLRSSASAYFNRTFTSTGNRQKWTLSTWQKIGDVSNGSILLQQYTDESNQSQVRFGNSSGQSRFYDLVGASFVCDISWSPAHRDPSAWYHVVFAVDTTQATNTDRIKFYVNGVQITATSSATWPSQNANLRFNTNTSHFINQNGAGSSFGDGYKTEINFIDGQALTPSSFGETDSITGVWKPKKYAGTYGTNGFYLNFSDNSSNTATTIGKDYSGNGNNWTPNNISVTSGSTYDSMTDVPTLTSATAANYAVLNPVDSYAAGLSNANLKFADGSGSVYQAYSTIVNSDIATYKFYCEVTVDASYGVGIAPETKSGSNSTDRTGVLAYYSTGLKYNGLTGSSYGASFTANDIIGIAVGNGQVEFFKNGVSQGVAFSSLTGAWKFAVWAAGATGIGCSFNFGQRPFSYTPPTGYVALNTYNLPTSTITNGAAYMAATLYAGSSSAQSITNTVNGVSFQPDLVWGKNRSNVNSHRLTDVNRGVGLVLFSNSTNGDTTGDGQLSSFNSNGWTFTSGAGAGLNESGNNYVAWNWKAGGTPVTNTNGSITSTVSAGATQGFSVVTYTGTGSAATVGHGLGVAPSMIIIKGRTGTANNWTVYHSAVGNTGALFLNLTNATDTGSAYWNNTSPTSSVFTINTGSGSNTSTYNYVAYCFAAVKGFSAFGSYTGNGSSDGPFVYCGFRPRYLLIRNSSIAASWEIIDTSRDPYNVAYHDLYAESSSAESTGTNRLDMLSNGFKIRDSNTFLNGNGNTVIYAAFAENPTKYALAR